MRDFIALPAFYVVSRAPLITTVSAGLDVVMVLTRPGTSLPARLAVLLLGLLASTVTGIACSLPMLRTTNGEPRSLQDACWETADDIAIWAGWQDWEDVADPSVQ